MTATCASCGSPATYGRNDRPLCESCYEMNVPSWSRRDSDRLDAASVDSTSQVQFATFPRRLNALTIDSLVLIGMSILVFLVLPTVQGLLPIRLFLAFMWWGTVIFYEPAMVARFGGTLGHWALNLRVVDDRTGGNPTLIKAIGRLPLKLFLGGFSFLTMSFTKRHQALHDLATATTVQIRDPSKAKPHHFVWGPQPHSPTEAT